MIKENPEKRNHLIVPPSLVKSTGKSGWYIKFWAFNMDSQKKERVRIKVHGKTVAQRINDANLIIKTITEAFESGAYISDVTRTETPEEKVIDTLTFKKALDSYLIHRKINLKKRSQETYTTWYNTVLEFFELKGYDKFFLTSVTKKHIREFFDYIIEVKNLSPKSFNDYIGFLSGFYIFQVDRQNVEENIVVGFIKRMKVISGKHVPYTMPQAKSILDYFDNINDEQTKLFLAFSYYTLARPREELRNLKVGDIKEHTIYFRPENAKSTENSYIVIPEPLEELIVKYQLREQDPNLYLFTPNKDKAFVPGEKITNSQFFYLKIKKCLKALKLTDKEYDLYSWKHTAVCQLFLSGVDIEAIRQQCRHSDIKQTIQYLKDLGMIRNAEIKLNFPRLNLSIAN
ncbi:tyrosine-type recombinase/integrase [Arcicella aquatica]|uniref:Tyrosine-type recombinase/integrase n=1 Tax=Arcicella aquatica TaxID=217141 RepID=A0ABU5QK05_9BACT|nr:tyrosine-type recombinase/integrase [Arcicella aquatica]MEA5257159.1 tyrosine-type recombinase/integrase [Arcicella aquatica]